MTNFTSGDLLEDAPAGKRTALSGKIDTARRDAKAGEEGATDTPTRLDQQLISSDDNAFGTARPWLSADRNAAFIGLERMVDLETERARFAAAQQHATTFAVNAGNALADGGNDLTADENARRDANLSVLAS